jgi:3-keto-disaccharide hydrolase
MPPPPIHLTLQRSTRMRTFTTLVNTVIVVLAVAGHSSAQVKQLPLESSKGLILHNVSAEPATLEGKKGVRLTMSQQTSDELSRLTPQERDQRRVEQLAKIEGVEFSNGTIEVEVAGAPAPDAPAGARGFVGIAFRVQPNNETYDAFYLRPTNGRADDQERRNHSTQYISHPDWTWSRLRKETPSKYESYVDLVPGVWTKIKIDVRGSVARLFVHGNEQPSLVVNDVKSGAQAKGAIALWLDIGTVAHFRNLTVTGN